jgi:hypothetical protein
MMGIASWSLINFEVLTVTIRLKNKIP